MRLSFVTFKWEKYFQSHFERIKSLLNSLLFKGKSFSSSRFPPQIRFMQNETKMFNAYLLVLIQNNSHNNKLANNLLTKSK